MNGLMTTDMKKANYTYTVHTSYIEPYSRAVSSEYLLFNARLTSCLGPKPARSLAKNEPVHFVNSTGDSSSKRAKM